ncbi:hypothetical protein Pan241w_01210 [Gimesia alba]|uniref:Uncharacterized protein n=1 Tax=Gimesia alba TaxID=2527973 RepID=A0A517R876_9PLAN|nr:hypothetical protein Pan241w_01210 [Gimesia alba]
MSDFGGLCKTVFPASCIFASGVGTSRPEVCRTLVRSEQRLAQGCRRCVKSWSYLSHFVAQFETPRCADFSKCV